jgi:hypothetical protein
MSARDRPFFARAAAMRRRLDLPFRKQQVAARDSFSRNIA